MCRSVSFRIGPVGIAGFVSDFVYKQTTKGNSKKRKAAKLNEFSKLNTKSGITQTMNNVKERFTITKALTTRKTLKMTILSRYTYVLYGTLSHIIELLLTSIV